MRKYLDANPFVSAGSSKVKRRQRVGDVFRVDKQYSVYRLTGIFRSNNRRGAVISKKIVYKGDRIYGAYVVEIRKEEVVLIENGQKIIITLGS